MAVAQGLYKKLAYMKQSALGSAASGAGGQYLRRETATFNKKKDTFNSNEITTHQQYTGDTYGVSKTEGAINGVLSADTYSELIASLLRKDMATTSAMTSLTLTIAGSGPFTITRSSGSWLTGGVKIGDVGRITAGTYSGTARDINVLITGVTATVLTVIVPNGKSLSAQSDIASSTFSIVGKKSVVPTSDHENDYYTFEEWYDDVDDSRLYDDVQIASAQIAIPATGNATIQLACLGLGRTKGDTQILTSPTAETQTAILSAANAMILIAGSRTEVGTSLNVSIDGQLQHGEAVIGSNTISDLVKGDVKVSGTITLQHEDETVSDFFDDEEAVAIIGVLFADESDTAEFVGFTIPRAKLMGDDIDDGKKQLVTTLPFTAELNSAGGESVANDEGIVSYQDSEA